jgi:hypothetical protein
MLAPTTFGIIPRQALARVDGLTAGELSNAVRLLQTATDESARVIDMQLPVFFGRRRLLDAARPTLTSAADDARAAARILERGEQALASSAPAVRRLADKLDEVSRLSNPTKAQSEDVTLLSEKYPNPWRKVLWDARDVRETLKLAAAGAQAHDAGALGPFLARHTRIGLQRTEAAAIRLLARNYADELGSFARPFGQIQPRDFDANMQIRQQFIQARIAAEQGRLLADRSLTRQAVADEMTKLLAIPDEQLSMAQLDRLSHLALLPPTLRPGLPALHGTSHHVSNIGVNGVPATRAPGALEQARAYLRWELQNPSDVAALVRASHDSALPVDPIMLEVVRARPDIQELARVRTVDLDRLTAMALGHATNDLGSPGHVDRTLDHLKAARAYLAAVDPATDAVRSIRDETGVLVERNIERIEGLRRDTYARHPDYAEIGRIASSLRAIGRLGQIPAAGSPPSHVSLGVAAARAGETLLW